MANSLTFNSIDLADYGLIVNSSNIPNFNQVYDSVLIKDISYGFVPKKPPKTMQFEITVLADTRAILDGYLDSIKSVIASETAKALAVDTITDRYWNAKLNGGLKGRYNGPSMFEGAITFVADDPMAYDNTETDSDHTINASPDTVIETPGGTGYIYPVWTLTPGENRTATIILENLTTDEEMQWTGTVSSGHDLVINSKTWHVTDNGVASMGEVVAGSVFPRLAPGIANSIKVTALYNAVNGNLNVTYRNRYL